MNSANCQSTGFSAAYLNFARELRSPDEVVNDLRPVVQSDNFLPEITPYLKQVYMTLIEAQTTNEKRQDYQKQYADLKRAETPDYAIGDKVLVTTHTRSSQDKHVTAKLDPKRDGPYTIIRRVSPVSYEIASSDQLDEPLGVYHCSALRMYHGGQSGSPIVPIRKRGRPRKNPEPIKAGSSTSPSSQPEGETVRTNSKTRPKRNIVGRTTCC